MSLLRKCAQRTATCMSSVRDLSTDIARQRGSGTPTRLMRFRNDLIGRQELPLRSDAWHSECFISTTVSPVDEYRERKESASVQDGYWVNPNQKESQILVARTLCKSANTPRMKRIRTAERQSSLRAKFTVMDRVAESAAGGKDAV